MFKPARLFAALLVLFAAPVAAPAADDPGTQAETVIVVANSAMKGSLKVAEAYLDMRDIPRENLIVLDADTGERIPRRAFIETLHNPLLEALLERGLIDAFEAPDGPFGRKAVTVFSNNLKYIVLCYGIPARIDESPAGEYDDAALLESALKGPLAALKNQFNEGPMARDEASVDGELALLLRRGMPFTGFIPNPFYQNKRPDGVRDILKVTRLDGPSPEAVIRMLENALKGERQGLKGRAYVDEDGRQGGFKAGNDWLAATAGVFRNLGYDLSHNTARKTFAADERFDEPVLYAGWYDRHVSGPFRLAGFQFPAGAVAAHLHSFSASPIRSDSKGWVGPFVHRGVSATFGNVAEPYLTFTHQYDLFFAALADGWNFGDAAYLALPVLSWQAVSIGDPLYRPFAVSLDEQIEMAGDPLGILSDQYVVIRRIRLLQSQGNIDEALAAATRGMRETPGPALGLERARLLEEAGNPEAAASALAFLAQLEPADPLHWGLYAEMADTLDRLGDADAALLIYRNLDKQRMPAPLKNAFLRRGIPVARNAGKPDIAVDWQTRVAPPKPKEDKDANSSTETPQ